MNEVRHTQIRNLISRAVKFWYSFFFLLFGRLSSFNCSFILFSLSFFLTCTFSYIHSPAILLHNLSVLFLRKFYHLQLHHIHYLTYICNTYINIFIFCLIAITCFRMSIFFIRCCSVPMYSDY